MLLRSVPFTTDCVWFGSNGVMIVIRGVSGVILVVRCHSMVVHDLYGQLCHCCHSMVVHDLYGQLCHCRHSHLVMNLYIVIVNNSDRYCEQP